MYFWSFKLISFASFYYVYLIKRLAPGERFEYFVLSLVVVISYIRECASFVKFCFILSLPFLLTPRLQTWRCLHQILDLE